MRIILDGSVCYEPQSASYKYFSQMLPRLGAHPDLQLEWIPSPTGILNPPAVVETRPSLFPSGRFFPNGPIKRSLSRLRTTIDDWRARIREARRLEPAVFHSFYYSTSPSPRVKNVVMVLDLILEKFSPRDGSAEDERMRRMKGFAISNAARRIAISTRTRDDLIEHYSLRPDQIDVIPLAVDTGFFAAPDFDAPRTGSPYLLQVGGRMNHKNFDRLLLAFRNRGLARDYRLVCAGEPWSNEERDRLRRLGLADGVTLVRKPSELALRDLYRNAAALIYPSLYEGFGLPPLEALACGTPVAASDVASIPEVVGDVAVRFDPSDPEAIADGIEEVLRPETQLRLRRLGPERARSFSWARTAELTVQCYRKALNG